jgi:hypothetical protein
MMAGEKRRLVGFGTYKRLGQTFMSRYFRLCPYGYAEANVLTKDLDSDQDQGRITAVGGCSPLVDTDWPLEPDEALEMAMALRGCQLYA